LGLFQTGRLRTDLRLCSAAISAADEARCRAGAEGIGVPEGLGRHSVARQRREPRMTLRWLCTSWLRLRQRLLDFHFHDAIEIVGGDLADQLERDPRVTADNEGLRYAVDTPFDRSTAGFVGADGAEGIAKTPEKASRILRLILVVDA